MLLLLKTLALLLTLGCLAYLGWKRPGSLVYVLAAAVALDISSTWYPSLGSSGAFGMVSLARIVTVVITLAAALRLWREPLQRDKLKWAFKQPLTRAFILYIGVGALSILVSVGRMKSLTEVVRLISLFVLFLSLIVLAERKQAWKLLGVVQWVGVALSPLALYEGKTLHFLWYANLATGEIARVNATFVDPNIFARYLALGIVSNLLLFYHEKRPKFKAIYIVSLLALLAALTVTLSRSGLLTTVLALIMLIILLPRTGIMMPAGLMTLFGGMIVILRPTVYERLATLKQGVGAVDEQRLYLWKAAWAMFRSHPLLGVGLGGFQQTFLKYYSALKTVPYGATLSHTTLMTIAAELGALGLLALAWVLVCAFRGLWRLRRLDNAAYVPGVGYLLWFLAVFISSQSEARFFEDPMIWLSMAMLLTLGYIDREGKNSFGA